MLSIDPTISFGAILNAGVLIIGFAVAFTKLGSRIDMLSQRVTSVESYMKEARDFQTRFAVIESRQNTHAQMVAALQADMRELKHGEGFVYPFGGHQRPPSDK